MCAISSLTSTFAISSPDEFLFWHMWNTILSHVICSYVSLGFTCDPQLIFGLLSYPWAKQIQPSWSGQNYTILAVAVSGTRLFWSTRFLVFLIFCFCIVRQIKLAAGHIVSFWAHIITTISHPIRSRDLHLLRITERIEYNLGSPLTYLQSFHKYPTSILSIQRPRSTRSSFIVTLARPPWSSSLN